MKSRIIYFSLLLLVNTVSHAMDNQGKVPVDDNAAQEVKRIIKAIKKFHFETACTLLNVNPQLGSVEAVREKAKKRVLQLPLLSGLKLLELLYIPAADLKGKKGVSLLQRALDSSTAEKELVIKKLLDLGADPIGKNTAGISHLEAAAQKIQDPNAKVFALMIAQQLEIARARRK